MSSSRSSSVAPWRAPRMFTVGLLLTVALLSTGCSEPPQVVATADSTATIAVGGRDIVTVTERSIRSGITITGSLNPAQSVVVKSQLAGQLQRIPVERGTRVRRGQLLATIDAQGIRAQTASAEASLASAERDLRAADTLYKAGAVSERDHSQAVLARDAALAQLTQSRETLSRAAVLSPISGVVSEKAVEAGEAVQIGATLFTIANIDSLELEGRVTPDQVAGARPGLTVQLSIDAYSGRTIVGRVSRVEPVADPGTRQVAVYVVVPNRDHALVAGLFASGLIVKSGGNEPVPSLPLSAVQVTGDEAVVFAIENDRVARRAVTLGVRDDALGWVEVRAGLPLGARVLLNAPENLTEGTIVRVMSDSAVSATPSASNRTGER
ncbi:MAG: efflux RND transporter periplasmic adaptor subunit [Gemmatimonadaceae bacterium]|nr:efflux RND transporter periplasmic adaptor subunit [Gemmatimonadaceae bacterium]